MSNNIDKMSHFVMGVSNDITKKCRATMLNDSTDICHLTVYAQQVEETRLRKRNRDANRTRPYDGGASKGNLIFKISQGLKKGFLTKFVPIYQG